jgi:hypothetical protein
VVGARGAQLETWLRLDHNALQHWVLPAFGPHERVELTLGGVYGTTLAGGRAFSATGPLFQAKLLLRRMPERLGFPGVAMVLGGVPPLHAGGFGATGWDGFGYLALTESLRPHDHFLVHANVGFYATTAAVEHPLALTWGVGTQLHLWRDLYGVAELFSGDPYAGASGGSMQGGVRYLVSHAVQLDTTVGAGLWGQPAQAPWVSVGLRIAGDGLW